MPEDAALLERVGKLSLFNMKVGADGHDYEKLENGTVVVKRVEIFKAGSFKDSLGDEHEWTVEHLLIMVNNFNTLRSEDKFPNVPVRRDHSWSVEGVIGYIASLSVDGDRLVADIEFTEPDDFAKFERGTYRSRSLEVGAYEDNDGVTRWPVVMGLAFVDIPAVEGLHRAGGQKVASYTLQRKEPDVPDTKPDEKHTPHTFTIGGHDTTDYAAVSRHIAKLEGDNAALKTQNETLELFAAEQRTTARHSYVDSLATDKKIVAPQVESLKKLVEGFTDDQFEGFKASYAAAPKQTLLENHVDGVTNPDGTGGQTDPKVEEINKLEEILSMHRMSGLSDDAIAKTASAKRLAVLKGA